MYDRRTDAERARDEKEELEWIRMQQEEADRKTAALKAELERMKAAAQSGSGQKNVRGSVTKALLPRIDILREATRLGTPITQQQEMLERAGIVVSYNSLRKFIQKFLAREYREFLANSRTTGMPLELKESPLSEDEQAEINAFVNGEKSEKATAAAPATKTKPLASTSSGTRSAPAKSIRKLRNKADEIDYDQFRE